MDVLSAISGSGMLGGLFGALGSGLGRLIGLFEMREKRRDRTLEMAHEKDQWAHEIELRTVQVRSDLTLGAQALDKVGVEGAWAGLNASINAEAQLHGGYAWVDAVRALVRPALTVLIWLIFIILFFAALAARLPGANGEAVVATFVNAVTFSASTALAWWFGDRSPQGVGK